MRMQRIHLEVATSSAITSACLRASQWQRSLVAMENAPIDLEVLAVGVSAAERHSSVASQDERIWLLHPQRC
eukprot:g15614.t1